LIDADSRNPHGIVELKLEAEFIQERRVTNKYKKVMFTIVFPKMIANRFEFLMMRRRIDCSEEFSYSGWDAELLILAL